MVRKRVIGVVRKVARRIRGKVYPHRADHSAGPVGRIRVFVREGRFDLAMDLAKREVFGGGVGPALILRVAELFAGSGRRGDAITAYEAAINCFASRGFLASALAVARKVAALAPNDPEKASRVSHLEAQREDAVAGGKKVVSTVPPAEVANASSPAAIKPIDLCPISEPAALELGYNGPEAHAVDIGGADPFEIGSASLADLFADDPADLSKKRAA